MLNRELDIRRYAAVLVERGVVRLDDVLTGELAGRLQACLESATPWSLAVRAGGQSRTVAADDYAAMDEPTRQALLTAAAQDAHRGFSFAYESYQMIQAYLAGRDPNHLLHRFVEILNSAPFLSFARSLTGDERIRKIDCQATCYRPGHFLTIHDDRDEGEGRLYAYVLGLTREWRPDWGGVLHFTDDQGEITRALVPRFNTLTVFRVPAHHYVSLVAPFADSGRYSITGWMRSA